VAQERLVSLTHQRTRIIADLLGGAPVGSDEDAMLKMEIISEAGATPRGLHGSTAIGCVAHAASRVSRKRV
jgi:hypothetical protein